jgi:mannitol/fructose-specific phosphotransferase system IIA component (Ntr-type)
MKLIDYTSETYFLPRVACDDLASVVVRLVDTLAADGIVTATDRLVAEIMHREAEGSSVLGNGLAIPHARFDAVSRLGMAMATLASPLRGDGAEALPVDVVILIVGPRGDPRHMLRILARLARLVKQSPFLDRLRRAETPRAMRQVLAESENASL